ncbi:hypothetical protein ACFEEJ_002273, partial [Neisseria gonorrhoeae]
NAASPARHCRAGGNGGPGKRLRIAKNRCTMDKRARRMMRQPYTLHPVRGARYLCEHPPLAAGRRGFSNRQFGGRGIGRFAESRRLRRACRRRYPAKQDLRDKICSNTQGGT